MEYNLALIGFGNVGQGLAEILSQKAQMLREKFDADIRIVALCDLVKGSIADPDGFDPRALLDHINENGHLKDFPAPDKGWDARKTIENSGANVLVELSFTDLKTGEPALSHMIQALESGMHVSTTNKGPAALHFPKLLELSKASGGTIGVEGCPSTTGLPSAWAKRSRAAASVNSPRAAGLSSVAKARETALP